jgi:hypothetical protein
MVGASEMATGGVVGSAVIPAATSPSRRQRSAAPLGAAHQEMAGAVRTHRYLIAGTTSNRASSAADSLDVYPAGRDTG